ncbi:methyltransferase domain-containing protein [Patescibacteria group bacterium]
MKMFGFKIVRLNSKSDNPSLFLNADLIREAKKENMYIGDYVEKKWNEVGTSEKIVKKIIKPYLKKDSVIIDVGSGTGRYTKQMLTFIPQGKIHIFELDSYWKKFLKEYFSKENNIKIHPANGYSYDTLSNDSIDVYCAINVFTYTNAMTTFRNLIEAARVVKPKGIIIFDFFNTDEKKGIFNYIETNITPQPGPWSIHSLSFLCSFMNKLGFKLIAKDKGLFNKYHSTYIILKKQLKPQTFLTTKT